LVIPRVADLVLLRSGRNLDDQVLRQTTLPDKPAKVDYRSRRTSKASGVIQVTLIKAKEISMGDWAGLVIREAVATNQLAIVNTVALVVEVMEPITVVGGEQTTGNNNIEDVILGYFMARDTWL